MAISEEEATAFFACAYALRYTSSWILRMLIKSYDLRINPSHPKAAQLMATALMRRWSNPETRQWLVGFISHTRFSHHPKHLTGDNPEVTLDELVTAYDARLPLLWICQMLRHQGRVEEIPQLLAQIEVEDGPEGIYDFWLGVARLTMRRVLDKRVPAGFSPSLEKREDRHTLKQKLKRKESMTRSVEQEMTTVLRSHTQAQDQAQQTEQEAEELLTTAQSEVAAAAAELDRRREAHLREIQELTARHTGQVEKLQRELASTRREFARALAERGARSGVAPLLGCSVAVRGDHQHAEAYHLLIESVGGRPTEGAADITIVMNTASAGAPGEAVFSTAGSGLAEFERVLHRQVLPYLGTHGGRFARR